MQRFSTFAREIHRRSVWQVLTIYLVGSWIGYQVVHALTDGIGLPDWVPGFAVVLFVIGLPIVLATAFIQEGAPGRSDRASGTAPPVEGLEPTAPARAAVRGASGMGPAEGAVARLFTWKRAVTGGILAFAFLGLATTGFMGMRTLGIGPAGTLMARGVMDARDPIVLADFGNATGDERLGEVVTDALRIDLLSSPVIELVSDRVLRETLERMRRSPAEPLDAELALEVAAREGFKAVIAGDVGAVGRGYVLTARVVATDGGQIVAGFRETAADEAALLAAIDRLSGAIRAKIGESLRSTRSSEPLEQVTTSSLEALRTYSRAIRIAEREGEILRAITLLEDAVARDPSFAMAHRKIGVLLSNLGVERHRRVEAVTRAYEHRDRLNERERGHAIAFYHSDVVGDPRAAVAAYETVLARYPDDWVARNNLALEYNNIGDYVSAESLLGPMRQNRTLGANHFANLAQALWGQRRFDEAREVLDEFEHTFPDSPMPIAGRVLAAAAEWDWAGAEAAVEAVQARFPGNVTAVARMLMEGANLDGAQGRLRNGLQKIERLAELASSLGLDAASVQALAVGVVLEASLTGDPARVEAATARLLERHPLESLEPMDRPYAALARAWLAAEMPDRAEAILAEYDAAVPDATRGLDRPTARLLNGMVAVHRGRTEQGLAAIEAAQRELLCGVCGLQQLGRAQERAGDTDAAIRSYTRYLETPDLLRLQADWSALGFVLQRLAELHDERGDTAAAAGYYSRFVELWAGADAELQPRVEAASRRLAQLARES
jgi:eukaryotic-like serine/threonine-protein kinase